MPPEDLRKKEQKKRAVSPAAQNFTFSPVHQENSSLANLVQETPISQATLNKSSVTQTSFVIHQNILKAAQTRGNFIEKLKPVKERKSNLENFQQVNRFKESKKSRMTQSTDNINLDELKMLTIEESKKIIEVAQTQENLTLSTLRTEEDEKLALTSRSQKRTNSSGKRTNYLKGLHSKYSTEPKPTPIDKRPTNLKKQCKQLSSSPIAEERPMLLQAEPVQMPM